ncbi:MAG: transposase [Clostridiales Family XIII bacterium]|jgi:hypothetical protein|nr:transposase [Clostridiales Family XIII bacterium]
MNNFTTETYIAKREILTYADKLSTGQQRPLRKFIADMEYGLIASGSVLLSSIADALKEDIHKDNTIERLSENLKKVMPKEIRKNYINAIRSEIPKDPIILLDDSEVIKPKGKKFESLGYVRDGSSENGSWEKGYWIAEAVALSKDKHPISLHSTVFSQYEKDFKSVNTHTFRAINAACAAIDGIGTFVCDRGYDSNNIFNYFYDKNQYFITRLKENRKLFFKGKWYSAKTLCRARKGKFKTTLKFRSGEKECYVSFINVQITAGKRPLRLVLVYGLGETPMMLATNKPILGKDDVVEICRTYLCRWRIEEYFRFKKQHFDFENFRVRNLRSINNLNTLVTYAISFIGRVMGKGPGSKLKTTCHERARPLRKKVLFYYYQIAKGLACILANARSGIRDWYKPLRVRNPQLCLKLTC